MHHNLILNRVSKNWELWIIFSISSSWGLQRPCSKTKNWHPILLSYDLRNGGIRARWLLSPHCNHPVFGTQAWVFHKLDIQIHTLSGPFPPYFRESLLPHPMRSYVKATFKIEMLWRRDREGPLSAQLPLLPRNSSMGVDCWILSGGGWVGCVCILWLL